MVGDNPADRTPELLSVTILRHRRYWQVMWIGRGGKNFRDFHAASMAAAVTGASEMAAEFDCGRPGGRRCGVPDLDLRSASASVQGTATADHRRTRPVHGTDASDGSVFAGATLEDLVAAAGANPAQAGDYAMSWLRPVSALRPRR